MGKDDFIRGYEVFSDVAGSDGSAKNGAEYVNRVQEAIETFERDINQFHGDNTSIPQMAGNIAEYYHAGTFNINATVNDSKYRVSVPRSNEYASPDIKGNWGNSEYQSKYIRSADKTAKAQAESNFEHYNKHSQTNWEQWLREHGLDDTDKHKAKYLGMNRLVPSDQIEEIKEFLRFKIAKEEMTRPEQADRYRETLDRLCKTIKSPDGTESIELSKRHAEELAKIVKTDEFKAYDEGLTTANLIRWEHILKQGIKNGVNAALISTVLKIAPDIYKCINQLILEGELQEDQLNNIGSKVVSTSAESFLKGSVSAALTVACKSGQAGAFMQSVDPTIIGALTVICVNTIIDSIKVSKGDMDTTQLVDNLMQNSFVIAMSTGFGLTMQALLPVFPLSFFIGSFIGSVVGAFVYRKTNKTIVSFCIDSGYTFFGLVDQDYELPKEVLKEIGVHTFEPETFEPETFEAETFDPESFDAETFDYETIECTFLRRGVIGVRKIGYVID